MLAPPTPTPNPSPVNATTLLHRQQQPLTLPEGQTLVVVISGDLGDGKTSLALGMLVGTSATPGHQKYAPLNDLLAPSDGQMVDLQRYRRLSDQNLPSLQGLTVESIAACACCDGRADFITKVEHRLTGPQAPKLVVIETGGQTNGGQAVAALDEKIGQRPGVRLVHVTVISSPQFESRENSGDFSVAALNLENADVVVITRAESDTTAAPVTQFVERILTGRSAEHRPAIFRSNEPSLVSLPLWEAITTKSVLAAHGTSKQVADPLEQQRLLTVRNTTAITVALYHEFADYVRNQVSAAWAKKPGIETLQTALVPIMGGLFNSYILPTLSRIACNSGLSPTALHGQICRIKGNFAFPEFGHDVDLDIYLNSAAPVVLPTVHPLPPTTAARAPTLTFYSRTPEPQPQWFTSVGLPTGLSGKIVQNTVNLLLGAKLMFPTLLAGNDTISPRTMADANYELIELIALDARACSGDSSRDPFRYNVAILGSSPRAARVLVQESFRHVLLHYLDFRVSALERLVGGRDLSSLPPPHASAAFSFALDLIVAHQTHGGKDRELSATQLAKDPELQAVWARAEKLNFGQIGLLSLARADSLRIRGTTELTPVAIAQLEYVVRYARADGAPDLIGGIEAALANGEAIATLQQYPGWTKEGLQKLRAECRRAATE